MLFAPTLVLALLAPPSGAATVRAKAGGSEIVLTTTNRLSGAVHSLTWDGVEFIDSADHGRQLQSAAAFDCGKPGFHPECFNPTEAGSRRDGAGETSTSRLVRFRAGQGGIESTTRMAFWLPPGEKSGGKPALNDRLLSEHLLTKKLTLGYKTWPHAIDYRATFTVPDAEKHTLAQFEAVTGYMPDRFEKFFTLDVRTGELAELSDGSGEQAKPVVFATKDGRHAMGVWSPDQPGKGYEKVGYGRFRFAAEKVVKWNCVFRVKEPKGVPAGEYSYRTVLAVGTSDDVRKTLSEIARAEGKGAK